MKLKTTTNFYYLLIFIQIILDYSLLDFIHVMGNDFFIKMKIFCIF